MVIRMHELSVLSQAVKTVNQIAVQHHIPSVKFITLEVGSESTYVPLFFHKLYPVAIEHFPLLHGSKLQTVTVPGKGLTIKEIGY